MLHLFSNELTGSLPRGLIGLSLVSFLWNRTERGRSPGGFQRHVAGRTTEGLRTALRAPTFPVRVSIRPAGPQPVEQRRFSAA